MSHYFVSRFLGLFAMVLAVAFLVLATVELVLNLGEMAAFGASDAAPSRTQDATGATTGFLTGAANVARYLGIRLTSYYLAELLPIASFVAMFLTFALAGRAHERLAAEAGGVPPARLVAPVLATALILSCAALVLHETVVLRAEQIWSGERSRRGSEIDFGRVAFWHHAGRFITRIEHADPETRTLHGVEIFERSPAGGVVRVIRSDRVAIEASGIWRIEDAIIWRFDATDSEAQPRLERSPTVALDLAALRGDLLLGADPQSLPLADLRRYLDSAPRETSSFLRRMRARYHERLAHPWLVAVFAWLALPFALRVDGRGRFAGPAAAAVSAIALYFLTESAGRTLAQQSLIPVGLTPWLTMVLFSVAAAFALVTGGRNATHSSPLPAGRTSDLRVPRRPGRGT